MEELWYRVALGMLLGLFTLITSSSIWRYNRAEKTSSRNSQLDRFLVLLNVLGMTVVPAAYVLTPRLDYLAMHLPDTVRSTGIVLYALALGFMWWILHTLGTNWSMFLELGSEHQLIRAGPYRYIRHPMYACFYLLMAAQLLISSNWVVGLFGLAAWDLLYRFRVPREEQMMLAEFGEEYAAYMRRTWRIVPKFR